MYDYPYSETDDFYTDQFLSSKYLVFQDQVGLVLWKQWSLVREGVAGNTRSQLLWQLDNNFDEARGTVLSDPICEDAHGTLELGKWVFQAKEEKDS